MIGILAVEDSLRISIVDGSVGSVCRELGNEMLVEKLWVATGSKVLVAIFEVEPAGRVSEIEDNEGCNCEDTDKDETAARELELWTSEDPDRVLVCPAGNEDASDKTGELEVITSEV
jgi:hypothetical protein